MSPPLVVLAPHPDDAALSAAATLLAWPGPRTVVSIFTGDAPAGLSDRARRILERSGLEPATAGAVRREEEARSCAVLGAETVHLDLPDAMYRSPRHVFARDAADEAVAEAAVRAALAPLLPRGAVVLAPRGTGGHRDHLVVRRAASALVPRGPRLYEDQPYGWFGRFAPAAGPRRRTVVRLGAEAWERKLEALAAHASQMRILWPGDWRAALAAGHAREGEVPVEHIWA